VSCNLYTPVSSAMHFQQASYANSLIAFFANEAIVVR
jgi:hypothetical protein